MSHSNLLREKNSEGSSGEENASGDYDAAASKALVRKQDLHLMPLAIWMYLLAYLDRSVRIYLRILTSDDDFETVDTRILAMPRYSTRRRAMIF